MNFDWNDLAFGSKEPMNALKAVFIAAPRELSPARFAQVVKEYLPSSSIVLGLAKELYILGFENQPQFKALEATTIQKVIDKVSQSPAEHKIYTLTYFQRDFKYLLEKLDFQKVLLVNGSWKQSFHTTEAYYTLTRHRIPYEMISPFATETEALAYEAETMKAISTANPFKPGSYTDTEMMALAQAAATYSFDYCGQTGVALAKKTGNSYDILVWTYNKVVPFQTYALHNGSEREKHFSPPHDLNHYDAVHAEVELILAVARQQIDLAGTSLFINILPCPNCSRMLADTPVAEFIYAYDHSDGFAVRLLEKAGKTVRRLLP